MGDDTLAAVDRAYEYLVWARTIDDEANKVFLEKVERITNKHLMFFAGLGFGLTQLDWVWGWFWVPVLFLGVSAGVLLGWAFGIGLHCSKIGLAQVVGVKHFNEDFLKGGAIFQAQDNVLAGELAHNMANAIIDNRNRQEPLIEFGKTLNCLTAWGYLCAALFLGLVIVGNNLCDRRIEYGREGQGQSVGSADDAKGNEAYCGRAGADGGT